NRRSGSVESGVPSGAPERYRAHDVVTRTHVGRRAWRSDQVKRWGDARANSGGFGQGVANPRRGFACGVGAAVELRTNVGGYGLRAAAWLTHQPERAQPTWRLSLGLA